MLGHVGTQCPEGWHQEVPVTGCLQEHHAQHPEAGSAAPGCPGEQLRAPRSLPEPTGFKRNTQLWGQGDAHTAPLGKWEPSTEKPIGR